MISERKLKVWRRYALKVVSEKEEIFQKFADSSAYLVDAYVECQQRILKLTQELLDQHLIRKG